MSAPNLQHIKNVTIVALSDSDTTELVCFTVNGTTLTTGVSITDGHEKLWASILREAADQIEAGLPTAGVGEIPVQN